MLRLPLPRSALVSAMLSACIVLTQHTKGDHCWPQQESGATPASSSAWGPDRVPSSVGERDEEEAEGGGGQSQSSSGRSDDGQASLQSVSLQHVTRQDDEGQNYKVVPQPIVAPQMVHPG